MSIYDNARIAADKLITLFKNEESAIIQRFTSVSDGQGGSVKTWNTLYSGLECAVVPMSGDEIVQAQRLNYEATHNVFLRYSDAVDIKSDDRILFDSRVFVVRDPRNLAEAKAAFKVRVQENVG